MVSRENRVIAGSFVLFVLAIVGLLALESAIGVAVGEQPLVVFLVVYGLPIVAPQLYLAATDGGGVSPRIRIRFATIVTGLFALAIAGNADVGWANALDNLETIQYTLLGAIGVGAFAGLLCYEFLVGYRSGRTDPTGS